MWVGSLVTTFVIPFAGYGLYAVQTFRTKSDMMVDSPEYASEISVGNPFEWLTGALNDYGWMLGVVALIGLVFVLFCIMFQVVSFFSERTELSGTDGRAEAAEKAVSKLEDDETVDDYGSVSW